MIARVKVHSKNGVLTMKKKFPEHFGRERGQPASETGARKDTDILSSERCTGWSVLSLGKKAEGSQWFPIEFRKEIKRTLFHYRQKQHTPLVPLVRTNKPINNKLPGMRRCCWCLSQSRAKAEFNVNCMPLRRCLFVFCTVFPAIRSVTLSATVMTKERSWSWFRFTKLSWNSLKYKTIETLSRPVQKWDFSRWVEIIFFRPLREEKIISG